MICNGRGRRGVARNALCAGVDYGIMVTGAIVIMQGQPLRLPRISVAPVQRWLFQMRRFVVNGRCRQRPYGYVC